MENLNNEHHCNAPQVNNDETVDMVKGYLLSIWVIPLILGLTAMFVLHYIFGINKDFSMLTGLLVMPVLALIVRIFEPKNTEAEIGKEGIEMFHFILYAICASLAFGVISGMLSFKFPIMEQVYPLIIVWSFSICCVIYIYRTSHKVDLVPLFIPALLTCTQLGPEIIKMIR